MARVRADRLLVARGLAATADEAGRRILAGEVWTGAHRVPSPGALLASDAELAVRAPRKYVSRGGLKLEGALDAMALDPAGRVCVDVGCSTGGFTDCLLRRGAAHVHAVDVGYGLLDATLRNDPRVTLHERTNVRAIDPASLDPAPDLAVADLSFISLRAVLASLVALVGGRGDLLVLVKPQFELPSRDVRGGVVRDPELRRRAVDLVREAAAALGLRETGQAESAVAGPKGNREIFVAFRAGPDADQPKSQG